MKLLDYRITLPSAVTPFRLIPFGCFAPDTEILTREGWKSRPSLVEGGEVMTLNTRTGKGEWQPIVTLIDHAAGVYPTLYHSPSHEFAITPDHGVWYQWAGKTAWHRRLAHQLPRSSSPSLKLPVAIRYEGKGVALSDEWLQLLGWFIAEGAFSWDRRGKTPRLDARLSQNEEGAAALLVVLERVGAKFHVTRSDRRGRQHRISGVGVVKPRGVELSITLKGDWPHRVWELIPNKLVPMWLLDCTTAQFEAFFDAIVCGDGQWHDRGRRGMLFQKDKTRLDLVQALCAIHGYKSKLSVCRQHPLLYRLTFRKVGVASLHRPLQRVAHDGPVWCLTVRNESVVVRRNGRPVILSNCLHADNEGHRKALWEQCRRDLLQPQTYGIGAGDYRDLLRTTARNYLQGYTADKGTMKTLDDLVDHSTQDFAQTYFAGLGDRMIGLGKGNHLYEYQDGTNDVQQLCKLLHTTYLDNPAFIRLTIRAAGKTVGVLRVLLHHGNWSGGSSRIGGSVNAAENKSIGFDADIYIFSHDHRKWAMHIPKLTIPSRGELQVVERPRCFIRTGCFVAGYDAKCGPGNYVQEKLMHPSDLGYVTLTVRFYQEYDKHRYARAVNKGQRDGGGRPGNMKYKFTVTF